MEIEELLVHAERKAEDVRLSEKKDAAVMIPLVRKNDEWSLLFEVRAASIAQPGEISFPGGKIEEGETPAYAAVRETCEELLVSEKNLTPAVAMHVLHSFADITVYSFACELKDYQNSYSEDEIDHLLLIPLRELLDAKCEIYDTRLLHELPEDFPYDQIPDGKNYSWRPMERKVYFYRLKEGVIWGLTAELLYRFLKTLKS